MAKANKKRAGKYQEKLKIVGNFEGVIGVSVNVPAKVTKLREDLKEEIKAFMDGVDKHSDYEVLKAIQTKIRSITNQLNEQEGRGAANEKQVPETKKRK